MRGGWSAKWWLGGMLAASATGASAQPVPVPAPAPAAGETFEGLPDVQLRHYPVTGRSLAAVRADMVRQRPTDPNDGLRVDALATVDYRWEYRGDRAADGGCAARITRFTTTHTVLLPRLAEDARLTRSERAAWDRYIARLRAHEAEHVRLNREGADEVRAAIAGQPCAEVNRLGAAAIARVGARNVAFDQRTRHGLEPGGGT